MRKFHGRRIGYLVYFIKCRSFLGAILGGFLVYFTDFPTASLVSSQQKTVCYVSVNNLFPTQIFGEVITIHVCFCLTVVSANNTCCAFLCRHSLYLEYL